MATVPMIVHEFGGIARTQSPMRFPIPVPLKHTDGVFNVNTCRVLDGATPVDAQFEIIARYGGGNSLIGGLNDDASKPARILHVWLNPSVGAGGVKNYTLNTAGGPGNAFSGITVQAQAAHYVVNTGTGGVIAHVPRTGPQSILRFLQLVGGATLISGDGGGLWVRGSAGDGQAADYVSRFDTAADGTPNDWTPTGVAQPVKYFTELTKPGPLRTTITVRRVRLRSTSGGSAFQGKARHTGPNSGIQARDMLADVSLTFFKGRREILVKVLNLSTGGGNGFSNVNLAADCTIDGFGIDVATVFGNTNAGLATRDEGAAEKWATATATADVTLRQTFAGYSNTLTSRPSPQYMSGATYGWSLAETGPFTLASATTQLEAGFDVTAADGSAGLLVAPWNWKNRFPMGWTYTRSTGTLRWELLNPAVGDNDRTGAGDHVLPGTQWLHGECWLIPHAGTLTNAQRRDAVRATAGRHMFRHNNAWVDTDLTHPIKGSQKVTLLGRCTGAVWNVSGAWRLAPRPLAARTAASGMLTNVGGQMSLAPLLPGSANRYEDACKRYDAWLNAVYDDTALTGNGIEFSAVQDASMLTTCAVPNPGFNSAGFPVGMLMGPLGWRADGCLPTSGGSGGPNDYEQNSYPGLFWLSTGELQHFALCWETTLHQATIDIYKSYARTGAGNPHAEQGRSCDRITRYYHTEGANNFGVIEFQNLPEAIVWGYVLTGEDVFRQVMDYVLNFVRNYFLGAMPIMTHDVRNRWVLTGQVTNGSNVITNVSPNTNAVVVSQGCAMSYTPYSTNFGMPNVSSSSGARLTFAAGVGSQPNAGDVAGNLTGAWIGARLEIPVGSGTHYEVTRYISTTQLDVKPTPPSLTNQTCRLRDYVTNRGSRLITAKTATTLTMGGGFSNDNHETGPVTISAASTGLLRRTAWPLHFMVALCRLFGETMKTAQEPDGLNIMELMWHMARHLVFCEQQFSSPGAIAQMGGLGTAINTGQQQVMMPSHGTRSHINATSTDYAVGPTLEAHVFAKAAASWGYGAIFTSATRTEVLNFLDRYCRFMFMGVDGLSPIESGGDMLRMGAPQRIPMARGGDLQSPTSYHMVAHGQTWTVVEHPSSPTRSGINDFRDCADDLTKMTNSASVTERFAGSGGVAGGKGSTSADQIGADALIYVAEEKYHPAGDLTRRNAYTRKAIQAWIDGATFQTTATGGAMGAYHNPNVWGNIFGGRGVANGNGINVIRHRHWLLNYGARLFERVAAGWSGGVADTVAPSVPQNLRLVNRTAGSIQVAWDASSDAIDPSPTYRLFRTGTPVGGVLTTTTFLDEGLTADTPYTYTVRAVDAANNPSNDSAPLVTATLAAGDTTPPTVPTDLDGTTTQTTATLTFTGSTDAESGVKHYLVERNGVDVGIVLP